MSLVGCVFPIGCMYLFLCIPVPAGLANQGDDVVQFDSRQFLIPIEIKPDRKQDIKELQLFASSDLGKTWEQVARVSPNDRAFRFDAPEDGLFWFKIRAVEKNTNATPLTLSSVAVTLKVNVHTGTPRTPKDPALVLKELRNEIGILRQQLQDIEKRMTEFEQAKPKQS